MLKIDQNTKKSNTENVHYNYLRAREEKSQIFDTSVLYLFNEISLVIHVIIAEKH